MARRPADPGAAQAAREAALEDAWSRLAEGVQSLRSSSGWKAWLDMAAHLPNYSVNNQLLIALQRPDSTMVCGYRQWQAHGRHVTAGQKALRVLAPMLRTIDVTDPATGQDSREPRITGFKAVPVFDVSQTDGDPLPQPPPVTLLEGQAPPGLWDRLAIQVTAAGFALSRAPSAVALGGANGVTHWRDRTVQVRADFSDAQAVKTLAHELGLVLMHDPGEQDGQVPCRGAKEVEAESVAYLVAAHEGLDTAGYTFGYVAGWAEAADPDVLTSTAERIRATAAAILDHQDEEIIEPVSAAAHLLTAAWTTPAPAPVLPIAVQPAAAMTV